MTKYYTEDGTEVELELTPEQIKEVSQKSKILEEEKMQLKEELDKLKEKNLNFQEFRKANEAEKKELMKGYTSKEKALIEKQMSLEEKFNSYVERNFSGHKSRVLDSLAGSDADLRKQIEDTAKTFQGEPLNEQELSQRLQNAYTLVKGTRPDINHLNQYMPSVSPVDEFKKQGNQKFTETDVGKAFYVKNFPHLAPKEDVKK